MFFKPEPLPGDNITGERAGHSGIFAAAVKLTGTLTVEPALTLLVMIGLLYMSCLALVMWHEGAVT